MKHPPASIDWTEQSRLATSADANSGPTAAFGAVETDHECLCRGATGGKPGVFRTVFGVLCALLSWCGLAVAFFFFLAMLAGCEFIYLPECDTQCQAAGGADAYGMSVQ